MTNTLSTTEAHAKGWRPLRVFLAEVQYFTPHLNLERTFMLWRHARVVPRSISPLRGWLDGHRMVLWPPETKTFMEDALQLRSLVSMKGGPKEKRSLSTPHAGLLVALWAKGWDYGDDLLRKSLLAVIARLAPTNVQEEQRAQWRRLSTLFVPEENGLSQKVVSEAGETKGIRQARAARFSRLSLKEIQHAVRAAHHEDFQAVREEAKELLDLTLYALSGGEKTRAKILEPQGSLKDLFFELLGALVIGMAYRMFQPLTFEDIPKNLGWVIGWKLADRRMERTTRRTEDTEEIARA